MAIKYICDRCGSKTDDGSKVFNIRLDATPTIRTGSYISGHMKSAEVGEALANQ